MSSLRLLMQNYSDSEDEISDEEHKSKRLKRGSRDESMKDELRDDVQVDQVNKETEFKRNETNSETNSPEITPSMDKMKLDKLNENKSYHQGYLEDDFFTVNRESEDEEEVEVIDSNASSHDEDNNEKLNDTSDHVEIEEESCRLSPKSFHRQLIGLDEKDIRIPNAPTNKQCSDKLTEQIIYYHNKMKEGMDMNKSILSRKALRNPSIYEKLITYCNIDEFGTNLPEEIFDPNQFRVKDSEHDPSS